MKILKNLRTKNQKVHCKPFDWYYTDCIAVSNPFVSKYVLIYSDVSGVGSATQFISALAHKQHRLRMSPVSMSRYKVY